MTVTFEKRKKDFLEKSDKSSIGEWDKRIVKLCKKINKKDDYFTLSSCSGRVVLIKNVVAKKHGLFIFRTHDKISLSELEKELKNAKGDVMFKQEPVILHIACRDMKSAHKLLIKAQKSGCKHSGIISISSNRIVVEIVGSESLGLPIVVNGKLIVDDNFLKNLVRESNARLSRTWQRINKLERLV